jgi:hypothetical protein
MCPRTGKVQVPRASAKFSTKTLVSLVPLLPVVPLPPPVLRPSSGWRFNLFCMMEVGFSVDAFVASGRMDQ